jgi:CBS domain-containing protein
MVPNSEDLVVKDALTPLQYRIFPDTPMDEVIDLMIRRGLHTVPVVGENLEVGDALSYVIPLSRETKGGESPQAAKHFPARDVMTRTVMCVSENQRLIEAANLMVNRDVEQLPVVREGELIGFITRAAILGRLMKD